MKIFILLWVVLTIPFLSSTVRAETTTPLPSKMRPTPKPLFPKSNVEVEWQEILDECPEAQLCIQGVLINSGGTSAVNVKLRVEIGNTSLAKPRVTKVIKLNESTMNPGDRQEFYFTLDRKTPYKDSKGKPKMIEVGKFNFKIVPVWAENKVKPAKRPASPR